jgi:hypothetical protein
VLQLSALNSPAIKWDEYRQSHSNSQRVTDEDGSDLQEEKAYRYILVIDEINRADLAKTLGEVMYLLEYRGKKNHVSLPHEMNGPANLTSVFDPQKTLARDPFEGGKSFYLPENLYLIGTMNHADRSISGFDMALRRRFAWSLLTFSSVALRRMLAQLLAEHTLTVRNSEPYVRRCCDINRRIENGEGAAGESALPFTSDNVIGHTYFAEIARIVAQRTGDTRDTKIIPADLERLWLYHLQPLLEDYLGFEVHGYRDELNGLRNHFVARLD